MHIYAVLSFACVLILNGASQRFCVLGVEPVLLVPSPLRTQIGAIIVRKVAVCMQRRVMVPPEKLCSYSRTFNIGGMGREGERTKMGEYRGEQGLMVFPTPRKADDKSFTVLALRGCIQAHTKQRLGGLHACGASWAGLYPHAGPLRRLSVRLACFRIPPAPPSVSAAYPVRRVPFFNVHWVFTLIIGLLVIVIGAAAACLFIRNGSPILICPFSCCVNTPKGCSVVYLFRGPLFGRRGFVIGLLLLRIDSLS